MVELRGTAGSLTAVSTGFLVSLVAVVLAVLGARFLIAALPLRRGTVRLTVADLVLVTIGMAGLIFHCGAMFFQSVVKALPGTDPVVGWINALGTTSIILYVVPAALILLGLRRQSLIPLAVVALGLTAVGVTMYNGGSLQAHLTAIFISVVLLAANAAMLIQPPGRRSQAAPQR